MRGPCVESLAVFFLNVFLNVPFLNLFDFPALSLFPCLHDLSLVDLQDWLAYLALLCLVCREDILLSPVVGVLDAFNALGSLDAAPVDAVLADEVRHGAHK